MKIKRLIAILAATCMLLAGCGSSDTEKNTKPTEQNNPQVGEIEYQPEPGGTLRIACFAPDTLNPLATQYQNVREVLMILYEGLFRTESNLKVTPILAESFSASTSNKIYTIKLRKDIKFHDGSPFDAEDVVATFNYIREYITPYSHMFANVLNYETHDPYTISIELISPQSDFVNNLDFPILPSGLAKESFEPNNPNFVPIGTGKFKYSGRMGNKYMTYDRFKSSRDSEDIYIDNIQVKYMHNSKDLYLAFDAGEIDMYTTDGDNWGEFTFTTSAKSFEAASPRYTYIGINTKNSKLASPEIRQDINKMIDKKEMVETVMFSHALPASLPTLSTAYYNAPDESDGQEEKQQTKPTANTATETASENDKKNETKDIQPAFNKYTDLTLTILFNTESKGKYRVAQFIKEELESYGIKIQFAEVGFDEYKRRIAENNYELYIGETLMNNNMNMDFMFNSMYKTDQNLCNFTNDQFDTFLNNINIMASESENARIAYRNFTEYFNQNMPQIPLYHTNSALFVSRRVKGNITPNISYFYSDVDKFFINYHE